jgi:hypothetical protein
LHVSLPSVGPTTFTTFGVAQDAKNIKRAKIETYLFMGRNYDRSYI